VSAHLAAWLLLILAGSASLAIDIWLGVRRSSGSLRSAVIATIAWTVAGLVFGIAVAVLLGGGPAARYYTVFTLEKTLSLDNVAVFAVILGAFAIPLERQSRILVGGILIALILRLALVAGGLAIVDAVHDVLIGFGVILLIAGARMLRPDAGHDGPPAAVTWLARRRIQPAVAALVAIGVADLVFAVDSVPAAFAVTRTPLIVVAANVFAVLGLRPLYEVLAIALTRLRLLDRAIGLLLCLIGVALCIEPFHSIPEWVLLGGVVAIIGGGVAASLLVDRREVDA
jgi:tellurite resistance protein TerC